MRIPGFGQVPIPRFAVYLVLVAGPLSLVPFVLVALSRASAEYPDKSRLGDAPNRPRIHLWQDMDNQPRLNPQAISQADPFAGDNRAMRTPPAGTVARGRLNEDDQLHLGYVPGEMVTLDGGVTEKKYYQGYPEGVEIDEAFVRRGQDQYNVYCGICHGESGNGNGMVWVRAQRLQAAGNAAITEPKNLLDLQSYGEDVYSNGKMYDIIVNGSPNGMMPGYAELIGVKDRWAIVAYVRALQFAQAAPLEALPPEMKAE